MVHHACGCIMSKPKELLICLKLRSRFHIRKFSHKVKNAATSSQSVHHLDKEEIYPGATNSQPPIIYLKGQSKCIDLGSSVNKHSLAYLNDIQKFNTFIKSQASKSNENLDCSDDIIESRVDSIHDGERKEGPNAKLVNAIQPHHLEWRAQTHDIFNLPSHYAKLSKIRLTGLVVTTTIAGYAMAPAPIDLIALSAVTIGTFLTSSAANTINQYFEVPFDSQMSRTKNRVLVRGYLSPLHAVTFANVCCFTGISLLYVGANPLTAGLGAMNLVLYTLIYTPMKRYSILNTWIGSVVGAIPPMMGWAACTGHLETGAWLMAGLLFAWQFPHFNALSWNLRPDYSRAGYRMMSVTNPRLCKITALRYSASLGILSILAPILDVTTWTFAIDSFPLNAYFTYKAWQFYRNGDSASSRKLFLFSLIHLPALMVLMLISKKHFIKPNDEKSNYQKFSENLKTIFHS